MKNVKKETANNIILQCEQKYQAQLKLVSDEINRLNEQTINCDKLDLVLIALEELKSSLNKSIEEMEYTKQKLK